MCEITAQGYEVVVSPVYSRDYFIVDRNNIVQEFSTSTHQSDYNSGLINHSSN